MLGELSVNLSADGRSVKWARVDAYVPRKGIGSMLYRQALEAEFFEKVTTIETTWTDDNASTFNQKRFEGLSEREAANLTPSAKRFGKLGWELDKVESGLDRLNAKYRRSASWVRRACG